MMSYLAFRTRTATVRLTGREVARIAALAQDALAAEIATPHYRQLRADLGLPATDSTFFKSQLFWLMSDGEAHRADGQDVYLFDLALNVLYQQQPAAGILCWLYDHALGHGWIADTDRRAFVAEIQAALDAGVARPGMGWDAIISFLREGTGEVATSRSVGTGFPHYQLALDAGTWSPRVFNPDDSRDEPAALWDQLEPAEQWGRCMQALRARPYLRWQPGSTGYVFGEFTIGQGDGLVCVGEG